MDKAPDAFRTISEVAEEIKVPQHVLRFWESRFAQIRPLKRGGGRRYYRPDDVDLLRGVRHLLYGEGYTIRGVQRILREQGLAFVQGVWCEGAEPPPPEMKEDRVGDDRSDQHAATSRDEDSAVLAASLPSRVGDNIEGVATTGPVRHRLGANTEGRRKLQTVLDNLVACGRLIDDALADASLPQND